MAEFYEGQPVKIYQSHLTSTQDGRIVRVGRDLVHVEMGAYRTIKAYRASDQRLAEQGAAYISHFRTLEQHEAEQRRIRAVERLRTFGCRFDLGSRSLPVEKLERIAQVLEDPC